MQSLPRFGVQFAFLMGVAGLGALVAPSCGGSSSNAAQAPAIPLLYGDGSAGALIVAASGTLTATNTQFTDVTINAGVILLVPSGAVLRCTGTFTVLGTLSLGSGGNGGFLEPGAGIGAGTLVPRWRDPSQGCADGLAGTGTVAGTSTACTGGQAGQGLGTASRFLRFPGYSAGGAGAGACGNPGAKGGGGLTVLAFGAISIPASGVIDADANPSDGGGGGGGGGVVVLASAVSVTVAGLVHANGLDGGGSDSDSGPGGGGGGGIINVMAPSIVGVDGTNFVVLPGNAGIQGAVASVTDAFRSGGGGGGGCGGAGGAGGNVSAGDSPAPAAAGQPGDVNRITADPAGLFP